MNAIVVVMEGGIVHEVCYMGKVTPERVIILDYDAEGLGKHEVHDIPQASGSTSEASLSAWTMSLLDEPIADYIERWWERETPMYVIYSDEEDAYWSNDYGWTERPHATWFSSDERKRLNLPIAGQWVELP